MNNLYSHDHTFQKVMGIPDRELKSIISTIAALKWLLYGKNKK